MKKSELKQLIRETIEEMAEGEGSGIGKGIVSTMGAFAKGAFGRPSVQKSAMLALQGRHDEAKSFLLSPLKDASDAAKKQVYDYLATIKPIKINGKTPSTSELLDNKPVNDWIDNQYIPWVEKVAGKKF